MFSTVKTECILAVICYEYSVGIVIESENLIDPKLQMLVFTDFF